MLNDMIDTIIKDPEHNNELNFFEVVEVITDRKLRPSCIIFADFECSIDQKVHKEYCICADEVNLKHELLDHFESFSPNFAVDFIKCCDDNSLIYFHNLTYDMNFLLKRFDRVKRNPIIFNSSDMSYKV